MSIMPIPPKIPPILGYEILKKVVQGAKKIWNKITGKDEIQDNISKQKGIDPNKSQAEDIAELNKLLIEYRSNISADAESMEQNMIVEYADMIEYILDALKEYNKALNVVRIETVKRKFVKVKKSLKGTFAEYINKRISLDDAECITVLRLPAGELKNNRLQELKEKAFIEAANEIIDNIRGAVADFLYDLEDAFTEQLERSEEKFAEKTEIFDKLSNSYDEDTHEAIMFNAEYLIAVCELAEEMI